MASFKTILFIRIFSGLSYMPFLYSAAKVFLNMFLYGSNELFRNSFMINNGFDICFFIFITYVWSKFFFIEYKIEGNYLIEKHPLGPKKNYAISEIRLVEKDGEFSWWPRLYAGMNWTRLHFKDGKKVNISWLTNQSKFLQNIKDKQLVIEKNNENNSPNA